MEGTGPPMQHLVSFDVPREGPELDKVLDSITVLLCFFCSRFQIFAAVNTCFTKKIY